MSMTEVLVVRIPKELKEEMKKVPINWPEYIRMMIKEKIRKEKMKKASEALDTIREKLPKMPEGSIAEWIREEREGR